MNLYMDESGSINRNSLEPFIIAIVIPNDIKRTKTIYKRFVSKNMNKLKQIDKDHKMFRNDGSFKELKGSSLSRDLKLEFIDYFCRNNLINVRYIVLDNVRIEERFTENKARTFNYLMKLFLQNSINKGYINAKELSLQIDERNIKTNSKFSLEDYIHQELILDVNIIDSVKVEYFDSSNNSIIQIADVFANIKYSDYRTNGSYSNTLAKYKKNGYIFPDFKFPQKNKS